MAKPAKSENYPSVHTWTTIPSKEFPVKFSHRKDVKNLSFIEGYCTLNYNFRMCKDPHNYELRPDGSFRRRKNELYNPPVKPDPYPAGCGRSVSSHCIGCRHFAWCDPDDETYD